RMKRMEDVPLSKDDPATPVRRLFDLMFNPASDLKLMPTLLTKGALGDWDSDKVAEQFSVTGRAARGPALRQFTQGGIPASVVPDLLGGSIEYKADGDQDGGYRVRVSFGGAGAQTFFVAREDGELKIASVSDSSDGAGSWIIKLLNE